MDGERDLEVDLLHSFSRLATTDREVLMKQFQKLLGNAINEDSAQFWLDMNNW